ncbi:hypothetical protein ABW19_dt0201302 [Dactylella cylindrospora]|nr:hypothetical protein ABW19_dt0201302 [Dactylella cylindrospora]
MSSTNVTTDIIDNTQNTTPTLQRTPSSSTMGSEIDPSDARSIQLSMQDALSAPSSSTQQVPSATVESFRNLSTSLSQKRLNYYLEATVLSKRNGDEQGEHESAAKAKDLIKELYPSDHISTIFYLRLGYYFRKHGLSSYALAAFNEIDAGKSNDLPLVKIKTSRVCYWYYKALSQLEEGVFEGVEDMARNGIAESLAISGIVQGQFVNMGYYVLALAGMVKGDTAEARFWKEQLPGDYKIPDLLYSKQTAVFRSIPTRNQLDAGQTSQEAVQDPERNVDGLVELTTQDMLLQDVGGLKRDVTELFDLVYVNYKELCERIKAIHRILDEKEDRDEDEVTIKELRKALTGQVVLGGEEGEGVVGRVKENEKGLEELKRRMNYLERQALR